MRKNIYLIIFPTFLFLGLFTYFPLLRSILDSFFDYRYTQNGAAIFVGLDNFSRLFQDDIFWTALQNNVLYLLFTVIPSVIIALALAVMLNENKIINRWFRTFFFLPTIIPLVSAATIWLFIFTPGIGLIDYYLSKLYGFVNNNFLGFKDSALMALSIVGIWKFSGYYMLFFLAGLQSIPNHVKEAAIMEGASKSQVFFKITLPLLRPTLNFVLVIATIYGVTQIEHIAVMTRGGPDNATMVLLLYIQDLALNSHDLGKASAATAVSLAMLLIYSILNLKVLEKGTYYEH